MDKDLKKSFQKGSFWGLGFVSVALVSSLVAATVTGVMNTFTSGEVLTAAKLNENFNSLKSAVDSIPSYVIPQTFWAECGKTTYEYDLWGNSGTFMPMAKSGTLQNIKIMINSNALTSQTVTPQIKINGVDSGILIPTITSTTGTGVVNISGTVDYVAGDAVSFFSGSCPTKNGESVQFRVIID